MGEESKRRKSKGAGKSTVIAAFITILCICIAGGVLYTYGVKLKTEIEYPLSYYDIVIEKSRKYGLEPALVYAIIKAESGFRPDVTSNKDAIGLMQVTKDTGTEIAEKMKKKDFNVEMLKQPEINIEFGCWFLNYLKNLESLNKGVSEDVIVAAYNGGQGNVAKWLKNPEYSKDGKTLSEIPFNETKNYVAKVKKYKEAYIKRLENSYVH